MTIENPKIYLEELWDWACFKDCFYPSKIEPTDIDGQVERNNRFLILEAKRPGVPLKRGQEIMLDAYMNVNKIAKIQIFTVIVFWGYAATCEIEQVQIWPRKIVRADFDYLHGLVRRWYVWANGLSLY